jgi:hypothetical protein
MEPLFRIERIYLETETVGSWYPMANQVVLCKTLELPWKENRRSISCIPEGDHLCRREAFTVKHPYPHFRLPNVVGRSGILVHRITYVKDLRGCIGVGQAFGDLNGDGVPDIVRSTMALQELYDSCPDEFVLRIIGKRGYKQKFGPGVQVA